MRLPFNETKATQAAARLLSLRGGQMSYMKLIKMLYLADREALLRWGRPITTDHYVSMDRGPVLSRILDLVTDGDEPGSPAIWSHYISDQAGHEVRLMGDPGCEELSDAEIGLLDEIFIRYGKMNRWDLVSLCHDLPEWKNPHGSALPIVYRDILRAGGKSDTEISAIEEELSDIARMESLLGTE